MNNIDLSLPQVLYPKEIIDGRLVEWANFDLYKNGLAKTSSEVEQGHDGNYYLVGYAPTPLTLQEQALSLSMPKETFVTMVEEMTTAFSLVDPTSQPITFADMWEWCSTDPTLLKLFITQTTVKRNDSIFNETTTKFAPQFLQYLDMMFVYQNEIMLEIEQSKAEGRPMDLTALLPQG